ncbi:MAG: hypothetical protein U9N61_10350 [Euryarchaeota archaeon]|nr:hypothetical protein [Euryarchaeota archaeon]
MKRLGFGLIGLVFVLMCGGCIIVPARTPVAMPYHGVYAYEGYEDYGDEYREDYRPRTRRTSWTGRPLYYPKAGRRHHRPRYSPLPRHHRPRYAHSPPSRRISSPTRERRAIPSPFFDVPPPPTAVKRATPPPPSARKARPAPSRSKVKAKRRRHRRRRKTPTSKRPPSSCKSDSCPPGCMRYFGSTLRM